MLNEQPKKTIDVTLLTNDELRPWTIDKKLEDKLMLEVASLERTISFTSPQKIAGIRGTSILDGKRPELEQHELQLKDSIVIPTGPFLSKPKVLLNDRSSNNSRKSANHTRPNSTVTAKSLVEESQTTAAASRPATKATEAEDPFESADAAYIAKVQTTIYKKSQQPKRTNVRNSPLKAIQYEPSKSPAILNVSTAEFSRLKELTERKRGMQ